MSREKGKCLAFLRSVVFQLTTYKVNELLTEMPSKRLLLRYLRHQSQLDGVSHGPTDGRTD